MSRWTPREVVKLMLREIDPSDAPEDADYIDEWEPEHQHPESDGGPDCAACWLHDYDAAVARKSGRFTVKDAEIRRAEARGVTFAMEELVRRDQFSERTLTILTALEARVMIGGYDSHIYPEPVDSGSTLSGD